MENLITVFLIALLILPPEKTRCFPLSPLYDKMSGSNTLRSILSIIDKIAAGCEDDLLRSLELLVSEYQAPKGTFAAILWYNIIHSFWQNARKHGSFRVKDECDLKIDKILTRCNVTDAKLMATLVELVKSEFNVWNEDFDELNRGLALEEILSKLVLETVRLSGKQKMEHILNIIDAIPTVSGVYNYLTKFCQRIGKVIESWQNWPSILKAIGKKCNNCKGNKSFGKDAMNVVYDAYASAINEGFRNSQTNEMFEFINTDKTCLSNKNVCLALIKHNEILMDERFMQLLYDWLTAAKQKDNKNWRRDLERYCRQFTNDSSLLLRLMKNFINYQFDWAILDAVLFEYPANFRLDFQIGRQILLLDGLDKAMARKIAKIVVVDFSESSDVQEVSKFCLELVGKGCLVVCNIIVKKCNEKVTILNDMAPVHHRNDTNLVNQLTLPVTLEYLKFSNLDGSFSFFSCVSLLFLFSRLYCLNQSCPFLCVASDLEVSCRLCFVFFCGVCVIFDTCF